MDGVRKRKGRCNTWSPSDTAFTRQRLILQRYYHATVAEDQAEADACVICLEPLVQKLSLYLPCKHVFHYACCQPLIAGRSYKCPLCRGNFSGALPGVGIPVGEPHVAGDHVEGDHVAGHHVEGHHVAGHHVEGPYTETVLMIHMDLYDLLMEVVWQNYQHNATLLLQEEELLEEEDLF